MTPPSPTRWSRLLDDPGIDATSAVMQVAERHAAVMAGLASADLRERAADIRQVGRMVSDRLGGRVPPTPPAGPFVLLAHEVTAPDLLEYAEQVTGAVSVLGGAGSHASIVARSLGVPLVVGVDPAALDAPAGVTVAVDGDSGAFLVDPDAATVARLRTRTGTPSAADLAVSRAQPARTTDGVDITLLANVASSTEARRALEAGAAGVGLLRTELPFLAATEWPTREQHEDALRPVLEVLRGRPVTVRLLDFTHDKVPPFLRGHGDTSSLTLLLARPGGARCPALRDPGHRPRAGPAADAADGHRPGRAGRGPGPAGPTPPGSSASTGCPRWARCSRCRPRSSGCPSWSRRPTSSPWAPTT